MPSATEFERRDKALFAFFMLTGARVGAVASLKLKHVDLFNGKVYQDPREVNTARDRLQAFARFVEVRTLQAELLSRAPRFSRT